MGRYLQQEYNIEKLPKMVEATALFLAVAPVFDPYIITEIAGFSIRINDILLFGLFLISLTQNRYLKLYKNTSIILVMCIELFFINIMSCVGENGGHFGTTVRILLIWTFYALAFNCMWQKSFRELFFKAVGIIAIIAAIVVLLQYCCGQLGIPMWNGRITFLQLSKTDQWAGYIQWNGDIRPCGIFQEPSYYGIYTLIALANFLQKDNVKCAIILIATMFLSSSLLAIIGAFIAVAWLLLFSKSVSSSTKKRMFLVALVAVCVLIGFKDLLNESSIMSYLSRRFSSFSIEITSGQKDRSSYARLIGNLDLLQQYDFYQLLVGVGANQFSNVFNTKVYSNVFVTTILNFGIAGLIVLLSAIRKLFKYSEKENLIYCILLVIIFACDLVWFNYYFFFLLTACIATSEKNMEVLGGKSK